MSEKLLNKLTELFMSKNKMLEPVTATLWIKKLEERFPNADIFIERAIDVMIWEVDDFPTLGKLGDYVMGQYRKTARQLMENPNEEVEQIAKRAGVNLEKWNNNQFDVDAEQRCVNRFAKQLLPKQEKPEPINADMKRFLSGVIEMNL